jgi:hypothetical protein
MLIILLEKVGAVKNNFARAKKPPLTKYLKK